MANNFEEIVSDVNLFTSTSVENTTLQSFELLLNISGVFSAVAGLVQSSASSSNPLFIQPKVC